MAMLAVPNQCMDVSIGVAEVRTLRVETSKARGIYTFGGPCRLFTSRQGRTGASPPPDGAVEARRQAE
jgi:hypothetical protein